MSEGIKVLSVSGGFNCFGRVQYLNLGEHVMALKGNQASSGMDKDTCYRCRKAVLDSEQGIECGGCKFRFHAKCEKILKPTYTAIVNHGGNKDGSLLVWYSTCCARTIGAVGDMIRDLKLEVQKLEAKIQLLNNESGATSVVEMKRDAAPLSWPVKQQVNEVMEIDKRKDKVVISGIKEGEDAQVG